MKTIFKIFWDDIRSLSRRFFASVVVLAITVLPALYAWVNIYANGNPYGNTNGIKIALASYDPGVDLEDGSHVNMADEVLEEMKTSDSIGWQFPGTPTDAIDGVRSGEYYAAIIFQDNFTYDMYNFEQALNDDKAPIIYYENQKASAIAPKITETAANTLQGTIKTKYLETVFSYVFDKTGDIADDITDGDMADETVQQLTNLRDTLRSYDSSISEFTAQSSSTRSGIQSTKKKLASTRAEAAQNAAQAEKDLAKARASLKALKKAIEERKKLIEKLAAEKKAEIEAAQKAAQENLQTEDQNKNTDQNSEQTAEQTTDQSQTAAQDSDQTKPHETEMTAALKTDAENRLKALETSADALEVALKELGPLSSSISTMLDNVDPVLDSADTTVGAIDAALKQTQEVVRSTADDIDDIIDKVNAVSEDRKLEVLATLLGGDPAEYAAFFSALVNVEVKEVYSVASYGAAMTPFYSVLALWVGGVILVAILNTHIDRKKYPGVTETQAFFGRFLLFFVVSQVQAAVTVAGDIYMLGCDPVHPGLMWLVASITSFVFTLLIYALTLSFGDIGKAMVVILMVIQIAGSSGSYPIEILPPIFGNVYKFFPFPYAINAMREALCGVYGSDLIRYLAELSVFGVIGLLIGLFVRKPFIGINRFVSEKIEETELL